MLASGAYEEGLTWPRPTTSRRGSGGSWSSSPTPSATAAIHRPSARSARRWASRPPPASTASSPTWSARACSTRTRRSPGPSGWPTRAPGPTGVVIPVLGRIAAGAPVLAAENVEEYLTVPVGFAKGGEHFALRVAGESMTGAGILDGDVVVVRRQDSAADGDIVAALLPGPAEDEATVKRLRRRGGRVTLHPREPRLLADRDDRRADPGQGRGGPAEALSSPPIPFVGKGTVHAATRHSSARSVRSPRSSNAWRRIPQSTRRSSGWRSAGGSGWWARAPASMRPSSGRRCSTRPAVRRRPSPRCSS